MINSLDELISCYIIENWNPQDAEEGQELCYLCHQRSRRNVHVDISDAKRAKESAYEKILHEYQDRKHCLASAKEHEARKISELFAKDTSLHNFRDFEKKVRS